MKNTKYEHVFVLTETNAAKQTEVCYCLSKITYGQDML